MIHWRKSVKIAGSPYNFLDPRITKLHYFAGFNVNKMIVLTALVGTLELCDILSELVLDNQVAVEKQFYCVIKSCTADPVVFVLHENIKRFNIKVADS